MDELLIMAIVCVAISTTISVAGTICMLLMVFKKDKPVDIQPIQSSPIDIIQHSKDVMDLIRSIAVVKCKIAFDKFRDTHDMSKLTRKNVESLISDTAHEINSDINESKLDLDDTIFNRSFYTSYVIDLTMYLIKHSLEQSIERIIDSEGE